ncbi:C6 transcription factor Prf, putative [Rhizoctonia solani]|uniref:C6 transcription factor Prf, putative n=1 Tax=Rhizoctonia solani TaxID=456999 RepID=A0A0K6FZJ7_9AGAM|nr:C6 transcription factor Prf, putative [Rhizoctonia solani]
MEEDTSGRRQSKRPTAQSSSSSLRDLRDGPRACLNCRRLKLRCTNERPHCGTCTSKGVTCEYDDSVRQSGRLAAAATTMNASRKRSAPTSTYAQVKESRQRKRAAAAATSCDFCRNDLRRKCDGLRPSCQSCIKRGVACHYSGPSLLATQASTSPSAPLATEQAAITVVSDNEPDSDVDMNSRSGSPDVPLSEIANEDPKIRYPQGNGLGNPGSTRNPDGTNCTRPVACFFCIQVELPCTGDYPTCVNCIRRSRVCAYPDPASYAHQFPRQSAVHARQLKDGRSGPPSPTKSLGASPGKRPPGTLDSGPSPARTGVLGGPVSLRDIVDPPRGGTRGGVLDAPPRAGVLDTPPTPRGVLDAPRSAVEHTHAPQPTLYTSRSLNQATPTPPSMSVSPDSSGGASIKVLGATPKSSDQNGITPVRPEIEPSEPSASWNRPRTGSTSAEMTRTLSDINLDAYRPPPLQPTLSPQRAPPASPPRAPPSRVPPPYKAGTRAQSPPRPIVQVTSSGSPRAPAPASRPSISTNLPPRPSQPLGRYGDIPRDAYPDGRPDYRRPRTSLNGRERTDSFDRDRDRDRDREGRNSFDRDRGGRDVIRDAIRAPSTWATSDRSRPQVLPPDSKITSPGIYARSASLRSSPMDMETDSG